MKKKNNRDITALVSRLGDYDVTPRGWVQFKCPFCVDSNRHFGVAPEGNGHCLRCGVDVSAVKLKKLLARMKFIKSSVGPVRVPDVSSEILDGGPRVGLPLAGWSRLVLREVGGFLERRAITYMTNRGVDLDLYEVGFFDQHPGFICWLFRMNGKPVYYQGRAITKNASLRTINPKTDSLWYKKSDVVFFYDMIKPGFEVVIVEGPFDAVAVTDLKLGRVGSPLLGKSVSRRQLQLLYRKKPSRLTVMLDPPAKDSDVGLASSRICQRASRIGFSVYKVRWPKDEGRDPSKLGAIEAGRILDTCVTRFSSHRRL